MDYLLDQLFDSLNDIIKVKIVDVCFIKTKVTENKETIHIKNNLLLMPTLTNR